jgi:hypothetical protein
MSAFEAVRGVRGLDDLRSRVAMVTMITIMTMRTRTMYDQPIYPLVNKHNYGKSMNITMFDA